MRATSTEALQAEISAAGDTMFVTLHGELDLATTSEAQSAIRRAERSTAGMVVVDLGGLGFVDLSGLRTLLAASARLDGRLKLLPAPEPVQRLFELTGTVGRLPFAR